MEDGSLYTILPSGVSPKDLDLVEYFRFCPIHTRAWMIIFRAASRWICPMIDIDGKSSNITAKRELILSIYVLT